MPPPYVTDDLGRTALKDVCGKLQMFLMMCICPPLQVSALELELFFLFVTCTGSHSPAIVTIDDELILFFQNGLPNIPFTNQDIQTAPSDPKSF